MRLNVPLTGPEELQGIADVLASGYLTQGRRTAEFESVVAEYLGSRFGVATSSCTTALHLALVALGIGQGDEVVVPDFTFPATANAVVQLGATPVLADVDPLTYNVTLETVSQAVSDRTRAIIVVHAFGQPADMDPILQYAAGLGIQVIEDAACALGALYKGRKAGSLGDVGCFSFHPRKIITTGEGGLIATNDAGLAERLAILRNHGGVRGELYQSFVDAGFNYRLSDLNAAVGLVQMRRLEQILDRRRTLAARYGETLSGLGIIPPFEAHDVVHPYQSYVVRLPDSVSRDEVIRALAARGIESTIGTYSLHNQPYFQRVHGYRPGQLAHSDRAFKESLTLPLYPQMTVREVDEVAHNLHDVLSIHRGGSEGQRSMPGDPRRDASRGRDHGA